MSLLQQASSEKDDAARGEEFTRGTSHIVIASVIAAIVVTLAILAYTMATRETPAATGQILRATAHFTHRDNTATDADGNPLSKETFDQVLLFTHLQLHNQGKNPLFLRSVMTNVTLADGIHTSYAAAPSDYERLFQAYPALAPLRGTALPMEITIAPGQTIDGDFVTSLRMTRAEWEARKGMNYSVSIQYNPDLVIAAPTAVAEQ